MLAPQFHCNGPRRLQPIEFDGTGPLGYVGGCGFVWHRDSQVVAHILLDQEAKLAPYTRRFRTPFGVAAAGTGSAMSEVQSVAGH